jgi:hypothetical protein
MSLGLVPLGGVLEIHFRSTAPDAIVVNPVLVEPESMASVDEMPAVLRQVFWRPGDTTVLKHKQSSLPERVVPALLLRT